MADIPFLKRLFSKSKNSKENPNISKSSQQQIPVPPKPMQLKPVLLSNQEKNQTGPQKQIPQPPKPQTKEIKPIKPIQTEQNKPVQKIEKKANEKEEVTKINEKEEVKKGNEKIKPVIPSNLKPIIKKDKEQREAEKEKNAPETKEPELSFDIDFKPKLFHIPDVPDKTKINLRYPLIPPYAFAHIFWDEKSNEIIYFVEEPKLTPTEIELLKLIKLGLEEIINISFIKAAKSKTVLKYLENNVQSILRELGTLVSRDSYNKIMYYIYRDSVGLNYIEPLMKDYYIEDIECNGNGFPLYIVHRKFQNLRTNVIFETEQELTDFVEKLAQKSGKYISYAKPLLDGTLPDGSRVNATYTEDITTRGPTFTIRKFTEKPWTPINLIQNGTASPEVFAFLWMVIENKFNIMVIGETASGKTTFLNAIADFIPPEQRIGSIEDTRELNLPHINWLPAVTRSGFGMPNILGKEVGEITLFDLLKETFRQNPDYVILGETRGREASVLFQGMASGHPSLSTFHAASVETLIRRLETPPIELSPTLVEALDVICVLTHAKQEENKRRLKELDEMISVEQGIGRAEYNPLFKWNPIEDKISLTTNESVIFKKIKERTGQTNEELMAEMKQRSQILQKMSEKNITDYKEFGEMIALFYKNKHIAYKKLGL